MIFSNYRYQCFLCAQLQMKYINKRSKCFDAVSSVAAWCPAHNTL